jgi:hypothetical protein
MKLSAWACAGIGGIVGAGITSLVLLRSVRETQRATLAELKAISQRLEAPEPMHAPAAFPPRIVMTGGIDSNTVEALAQRVSALLAEKRKAETVRDQTADDKSSGQPPSAQQARARSEAQSLIEATLSSGRMTHNSFVDIQRALLEIDNKELVDELRRRIIVAINRNQLTPENPNEMVP